MQDEPAVHSNGPRLKGRGAQDNPPNRFVPIEVEPDPEWRDEDAPAPKTQFFRDSTRAILAENDSPDIGFRYSLNPYRGCEHGCIYCYARPTHEYFGLSAGLDFESKIFVKEDAPRLLRERLASRKWTPETIAIGGVTDPYQPVERKLELTRRCLEVFAEFMNPVMLVTKNRMVARDQDVLARLAEKNAAAVCVSVTTLNEDLRSKLEPRTSPPQRRLDAVRELSRAGVPVGVLMAPIIPGLTDHEIPQVVEAAASAGASFASYVPLRLPYGVKELFDGWLERHFPEYRKKVIHQAQALRGGKLNDARFGSRMRGEGPYADHLEQMFRLSCRRAGLPGLPPLSTSAFQRVAPGPQLELF